MVKIHVDGIKEAYNVILESYKYFFTFLIDQLIFFIIN